MNTSDRLALATRSDLLADKLSAAVEELNAETDPRERVEIFSRVKELRAALSRRPTMRFRTNDESR